MKADTIVKNARRELGDIIITLMRKLGGYFATDDKRLMSAPDEEVYIEAFCLAEVPKTMVRVDNSYLDVEDVITEKRPITQFILEGNEGNDKLTFCASGAEDAAIDIKPEEVSIEELARIASFLENECDLL